MNHSISIITLILLMGILSNGLPGCKRIDDRHRWEYNMECVFSNIDDTFLEQNKIEEEQERVEVFRVKSSNISDIPKDSLLELTKLLTLSFVECGMKNLQKESILRLPQSIKDLQITGNEFTALEKRMFSSLVELGHLNLSYGKLDTIHPNAFGGIGKLETLILAGNKLEFINSTMFTDLENLKTIDMSLNLFTVLETGLFEANLKLESISFHSNRLVAVENGFISAKQLGSLNLFNNSLITFDTTMTKIQRLDISCNKLQEIFISNTMINLNASVNVIQTLTCANELLIKELDLHNNSLKFSSCISRGTFMTHLDLSNNNLGRLNYSSFAALTQLQELRLRNSNLVGFGTGVLSHQSILQALDLSRNKLGNFPINLIIAAGNLRVLILDGNDMTEIPYQDFGHSFQHLRILGLGDNLFNCSYLGRVVAYCNSRSISTVVTPGSKVIHTSNIKGISCVDDALDTYLTPLNLETNSSKADANAAIRQVSAIVTATNNLQTVVKDLSSNIMDIQVQTSSFTQELQTMKEKFVKLEIQVDSRLANSNSMENQIMWIQNLLVVVITVGLLTICYKTYHKFKHLSPMRRFNTDATINTTIEMNGGGN